MQNIFYGDYNFFLKAATLSDLSIYDVSLKYPTIMELVKDISSFKNMSFVFSKSILIYSTEKNYRSIIANLSDSDVDANVLIVENANDHRLPLLLRSLRAVDLDFDIKFFKKDTTEFVCINFNRCLKDTFQKWSSLYSNYLEHSEINSFLSTLNKSVENMLPLSLIRIGHCETKLISRDILFGETDLASTYEIQWGAEVNQIADEQLNWVRQGLINAIKKSSFIGYNERSKFRTDYLGILENTVSKALIDFSLVCRSQKRVLPNLHWHLALNQNFFDILNRALGIVLVTPRLNLQKKFETIFTPIQGIHLIDIPGEFKIDGEFNIDDRFKHFMDADEKIKKLSSPGMVFLIGGGLAGKKFIATVVDSGGIAIDMGSALDAWSGLNTRSSIDERFLKFLNFQVDRFRKN